MGNYIMMQIYIDKNKDITIVPYKECKYGYALAVGPYKKIENEKWDNISGYIIDMMKDLAVKPQTEDTESKVMKELCGNRGFKQFSKKHICIEVNYKIDEKVFIISNVPRLSDGSYGVEKGSVSEHYCKKHICGENEDFIQKNFMQACEEAEQYLQRIGSI